VNDLQYEAETKMPTGTDMYLKIILASSKAATAEAAFDLRKVAT
jgi:hypothetical protein